MKSGTRVRVIVATVCLLSFQACTNADVEFTDVVGAAGEPTRAGAAGRTSAAAGSPSAGSGATTGDAGSSTSGAAGEAGDTGASGAPGESGGSPNGGGGSPNGGGGSPNGGGGSPNGGGGQGGSAGTTGGQAGRGGAAGAGAGSGGASAGKGGVGTGGAGVGGAGTGGTGGTGGKTGGAGQSSGGVGGTAAGGAGGTGPTCGNGVRDPGEQCDDGNTASLDACSATCAFEQSHRANSIEQKFTPSSLCPKNAFGGAFAGSAQITLQAMLNQRVADGSLSLLFAFRDLSDLSGTGSESLTLGVVFGAPSVTANYNGSSDLDWWYTPASGQVSSNGALYASASASLASGVITASPGSILLPLLSQVPLALSSTKVRLTLGAASTPITATNGTAPGHLANEHLQPSLVSFASAGLPPPVNGDLGQLCGDINAASLSGVTIPAAYAVGGASACAEGYGAVRSFLDLLVGGCTVAGEPVVLATQPDESDPTVTQAGGGAPYRLTTNATTHAVTGCRDKGNTVVTLSTCLRAAAFSSAYRIKTGRVIIK